MKQLEDFLKENNDENSVELSEDYLDYCKVYFYDYIGYKYIYQYLSNGVKRSVIVKVVEDEDNNPHLEVNGEYLLLPEDSFKECNDVDDCGVVIGRSVIKDHDGEVRMSFVDESFEHVAPIVVLTKEWMYKPFKEEDLSWTLTFYANHGCPISEYEFWEVHNEDIERIKKMVRESDTDGLYNYMRQENSWEIRDVLNIWGDESSEYVSIEVLDENGDEVGSTPFIIRESNVFNYPSQMTTDILDVNDPPQYILFTSDTVKRSYATFAVPKNFNVLGVRFLSNNVVKPSILDCKQFGDIVTGIWKFRYCGTFFECKDLGDGGNYGIDKIYLYEWNKTHRRYDKVGSCK